MEELCGGYRLFGADGPDQRPPDLGPTERGVLHILAHAHVHAHGMTTSALRREVGELRTYMSNTKHDACTSYACARTTACPFACTHTHTHARDVLPHLCHLHPSLQTTPASPTRPCHHPRYSVRCSQSPRLRRRPRGGRSGERLVLRARERFHVA